MAPRRKRSVTRRAPLSYEQRYKQLYKYPRKSTFNDYYIKNNYLHRIRLTSDIDGLNRLRDRKKRVNYSEDQNKRTRQRSLANGVSGIRRTNRDKEKHNIPISNEEAVIPIRIAADNRYHHEESGLLDADSMIGSAVNISNSISTQQNHQYRSGVDESEEMNLSLESIDIFDPADTPTSSLLSPGFFVFDDIEHLRDSDDILFVEGERSDNTEENTFDSSFEASKTIKITLKEIKQIASGHRCLTHRVKPKRNYCSICDIKLNNYIVQKKILCFNLSKTLDGQRDDGINVILPDVTIANGFKLRHSSFKRDFFTYRSS